MISFRSLYNKLLKNYGPQGWWPIIDSESGLSVYKSRSRYNNIEKFEIFIGAILAQGISWKNAEKAVYNLKKEKCLEPAALKKISLEKLGSMIKPAGYFNQKAIKVKNFVSWFENYDFNFTVLNKIEDNRLRESLLSVNGIGPETADSMLNYALGRNFFVVDAYTKRILSRLGHIDEAEDYHKVQNMFYKKFKSDVNDLKEFHSLIVVHGSTICKKTPLCGICPLYKNCIKKSS